MMEDTTFPQDIAYEYEDNPFNPSFGSAPLEYIHRQDVETKLMNKFHTAHPTVQSYMITGARGTGKTVLMHEMANRFESYGDWVVARMNPNMDMITALVGKLAGHRRIAPLIKSARLNLSYFGIELGVEVEKNDAPIFDAEYAIAEILKTMRENGERLLIIVDEATGTQHMKAFVSAYQNFIGQNLPVYLLMTGLYEKINNLKNEDNLTFLYRMPRIYLGPLQLGEIAESYRRVFHAEVATSRKMAALTRGYSYAFQLLGDLTWEANGNYANVLQQYESELDEVVYEKIWEESSPIEKDILYCIASSDHGSVQEIRTKAGRAPNEFSPFSDRLKKKGIAHSEKRGTIELSLPFFKGYVLRRYDGPLLAADFFEGLPQGL